MSHKVKNIKTIKFGEHLIFDAYGCDPDRLNDPKFCIKILNNTVKLADMHKLAEPFLVKADPNTAVGGKDPGGYSGFVIIQESHISIHTFAKRGFVTMDVYSCKPFPHQKLVEYLKKAFIAKDIDVIRMDRGLKYPSKNIY